MTVSVESDDLGTYLGVTVNDDRADYLIAQATNLCLSVVNPLPDGSEAVILDVSARAYLNPGNTVSQITGPHSANFGAVAGGLWLTRQNKATLRRLSGGGGAFTFDTMPATAAQGLPVWDQNVYAPDGYGWSDDPLS